MLKLLTIELERLVNEKLALLNNEVCLEASHTDLANSYIEVKKFCFGSAEYIATLVAGRIEAKKKPLN